MLPFKFKTRKCEEIMFRNAAAHNMNFFLRIHTNPTLLPFNDLSKSLEYFDSQPTEAPTIVSLNHPHNCSVYLALEPSLCDRGHGRGHFHEHVQ